MANFFLDVSISENLKLKFSKLIDCGPVAVKCKLFLVDSTVEEVTVVVQPDFDQLKYNSSGKRIDKSTLVKHFDSKKFKNKIRHIMVLHISCGIEHLNKTREVVIDSFLKGRTQRIFNYVYVIVLSNNLLYVGKHSTNDLDDGYCGSSGLIHHIKTELGTDFIRTAYKFILKNFESSFEAEQAEEYVIRLFEKDPEFKLLNVWRDTRFSNISDTDLRKVFKKGAKIMQYNTMVWK